MAKRGKKAIDLDRILEEFSSDSNDDYVPVRSITKRLNKKKTSKKDALEKKKALERAFAKGPIDKSKQASAKARSDGVNSIEQTTGSGKGDVNNGENSNQLSDDANNEVVTQETTKGSESEADDQSNTNTGTIVKSIVERVSKLESGQDEILSLLRAMSSSSQENPKRTKANHKLRLYEDDESDCEYEVDYDRYKYARDSNTGCAFASRILSALFNTVGELYQSSWSGQKPRVESLKPGEVVKKSLNPKKRAALIKAVQKHYPNDQKATPRAIVDAVGNKLRSFQVLFEKWRAGEKVDAKDVKGLVEMDGIGISDYHLYKKDPTLFNSFESNDSTN